MLAQLDMETNIDVEAPVPTLEQLACRAQDGNGEDFERLVQRVNGPLRRFLSSRLRAGADVDDLVQETLIRAHENLHRYDRARPFQTWLFTIGKRLAVNQGAATRRRDALVESAAKREQEQPSSTAATLGDVWQSAKACLSDEQYRALWLRYVEGYSVKELAKELRRTAVSTKVMLFRARKKLLAEVRA